MKDYKIKVMAMRGMEQIQIEELHEQQTEHLSSIDIGKVGKYIVLHPETRIELWIEESEVKAVEVED